MLLVPPLSRRTLLHGAALAAGASLLPRPARAADALITRPIPSSGERLPAMGIGTSRRRLSRPPPGAAGSAPARWSWSKRPPGPAWSCRPVSRNWSGAATARRR